MPIFIFFLKYKIKFSKKMPTAISMPKPPPTRKREKYTTFFGDYFSVLRDIEEFEEFDMIQKKTKRFKTEKTKKRSGRFIFELILKVKRQFSEIPDPSDPKKSKYSFSNEQERFWNEAIVVCLPAIFSEEELIQDLKYLKERLGFDEIYPMLIILAMRKIGKTFFMCLFVLWLSYCIPETIAAIFSTGKTTTTMVLEYIQKFAIDLGIIHGSDVFHRSAISSQRFSIKNYWDGTSIMNGYPVSEIDRSFNF